VGGGPPACAGGWDERVVCVCVCVCVCDQVMMICVRPLGVSRRSLALVASRAVAVSPHPALRRAAEGGAFYWIS